MPQPHPGPEPGAYFHRIDADTYRPTEATGGAWSPDEQHISPIIGLMVHAIEQHAGGGGTTAAPDGKVIGRLSVDILGAIAMDDFRIRVETLRPGRTIELVEATVLAPDTSGGPTDGRVLARGRAWRMATYDSAAVAATTASPLPAPEECAKYDLTTDWPGGYIASLGIRRSRDTVPGRTAAWLWTGTDLIDGEATSDLARYVALVDTANGISVRKSAAEVMFPNLDLTVHFHRQPVSADRVGFDTAVTFGPTGQGLTQSVLHDVDGPVGYATQILTVRPQ